MGSSPAAVYCVLGTPGSGRREIVRDLIENGLDAADRAVVIWARTEAADPADEKLAARAQTTVVRADWTPTDLAAVELPAGATVFLLADPRADVVTQLESLKPWLAARGGALARILTVIDCQFAEARPVARAWFEACVHFSDVVFLTNRTGVANKWVSDFLGHLAENCSPALFLQLKKGGVPNPALVLNPEPRRLTQYFDDEVDFSDLVIETDDDEDDDGLPPAEPYFERLRSGRRVKEVPDLAKLLAGAAS